MHLKMSSAICFNLNQSKILLSGNGLKVIIGDFTPLGSNIKKPNPFEFVHDTTHPLLSND